MSRGRRQKEKWDPYSRHAVEVVKPDVSSGDWNLTSFTILRQIMARTECNAAIYLTHVGLEIHKLEEVLRDQDEGMERAVPAVLEQCLEIAGKGNTVGTDHVLLALLSVDCSARDLLHKFQITADNLRDFMNLILREA